jgi:ribosomal peptide maturation radical SAM protein 1
MSGNQSLVTLSPGRSGVSAVNGSSVKAPVRASGAIRVALVSMPFVSISRPSIQLGLLKAIAVAKGFHAETFHLNLNFAQQIGSRQYEALCRHRGRMFGDWLFSLAAFGERAPDLNGALLRRYPSEVEGLLKDAGTTEERLHELREVEAQRFLETSLKMEAWGGFTVIGFTSTFQQTVASVALGKLIKQRFPDVICLFGGANLEGEMGIELTRSLESIDYAIIGEADEAFPEFLSALQANADPASVPGVACRRNGAVAAPLARPLLRDLDSLPPPDYDEYFQRAEALGLLPRGGRRQVDLPFESARGCWWGEKHHCTFCGLNANGMKFRSKSPAKLRDDLAYMASRYRSFHFEAVDNIVDHTYIETVFEPLTRAGAAYRFFYEVKSNLTREQIRALSLAGVRRIQPGIESLNSRVLGLMRKGVSGIQNANVLKWASYYQISVGWNLIWGFPGETAEDYALQLRLLKNIVHLPPPGAAGRIWMERFSPLFFDRETFGAEFVRPEASYSHVYPAECDLSKIAYFFDYRLAGSLPEAVYEPTRTFVRKWDALWREERKPALTFWLAGDFLQIEDTRDRDKPGIYSFGYPLSSIYAQSSDSPQSARRLRQDLELEWPEEEIEGALDEFCARGLMMREGRQFLALALPATRGR